MVVLGLDMRPEEVRASADAVFDQIDSNGYYIQPNSALTAPAGDGVIDRREFLAAMPR